MIESEQSLSGKKLQIKNPINNFISSTKITDGLLFNEDFNKQLNKDKEALNSYIKAVNQTGNIQNSFDMYMSSASDGAQSFAKDIEVANGKIENSGKVIANYTKSANTAQVSNLALDKSFANCQKIMNEYNSGCKNVNLSQEDFISAVGSSNSVMGHYLSSLQGGQANMKGYTTALIGAKVQTIALNVASTALNAAITMGVGLAIQGLITLADKLIVTSDEAIQMGEDAKNAISEINTATEDASDVVVTATDRFAELARGVNLVNGENISLSNEDYNEFLSISNDLAETFPTLTRIYDENGNAIVQLNGDAETINRTLQTLLKTEQQIANQQIVEQMPNLYTGIKEQSDQYNKQVTELQDDMDKNLAYIKSYDQSVNQAISAGNLDILKYMTPSSDRTLLQYDKDIRAILDKYNIQYERENSDATGYTTWSLIDNEDNIKAFRENQNEINTEIQKYFSGITTEYQIQVDEAQKSIASIQNQNKSNWSGLLSGISAYLNENDVYNSLSDNARTAVQSIINSMDYSSLDFKNWNELKDFINDDILDLFSNDPDSAQKITAFLDVQTRFNGNECSVSEYQSALTDIESYINGLNIDEDTKKQLTLALDDTSFKDNYDKLLKNLNLNDPSASGYDQGLKDWIDSLNSSELQAVLSLSVDTESATWSLDEWKSHLENNLQIDAALNFDISAAEQSFSDLQKAVQDSLSSEYGTSSENRSLISSMFGSLDDFDSSELFDKTSAGIKLNIDELNRLQKEQAKIQRQKFDDSLSSLYDEYRDLTTKIQNCTDKTGDEYNQLVESRNATVDKINTISELQAEYDGLTSAYARWQAALANGEEGDMYDSIRSEYENAKELYDQGLLGTSEFESYMEMLTGRDLSTASYKEMEQVWKDLDKSIQGTGYSIKDFLAEGSVGVESFLKAASKIPDTGITEQDGIFNINVDDLSKLAEQLGVGEDLIVALLQKARDYRLDIDFTDSSEEFDKIITKAQEASEELRNLGLTEMKFDFTTTDESSLNTQLEEAKRLYDSLARDENGKIDLNVDGAAEVATVYQTLLEQKQKLNSPIIMDVDVSQIDDAALSEDIGEIQQIFSKQAEIEVQATLGNDTTELQKELQELISNASESGNQILFGLDIDENTSMEEIEEKVNAWAQDPENAQILLDAGIDDSRLTNEADKVKQYIQGALDGIQVDLQFDNKILDDLFGGTITVNADTSQANEALDETQSKKDEATQDGTVTVDGNVGNALSSLGRVQSITGSLAGGVTVDADANTTDATKKFNALEALKKLIGIPQTAKVNAETSTASSALGGILNRLVSIAKTWTARVTTVFSGSSGTAKQNTSTKSVRPNAASGIGHVNGTANASGNWGAKRTETALMGEIAPELWVHSDTGTWELVENPQFRKVRKGDIIFNGDQTDELMRQGTIDAFGHSFLSGTAYKTGATGSGSIPHKTGSSSSGSKKSSGSSKKSSSSSSAKEEAEETLETIDWIEIAIDRIERAIDSLDLKASSVYKTWGTRNSALKNQISEIADEIDLQSRGYNRYIQEANSVGLSSNLANRVKNGTIDINEYDSETQELIKDYQEWYEKALDCQKAIEELKETQADLYKQSFDNVSTQYDGMLQVIEYRKSMLDEFLSQSEEKGLIESTNYYDALITQEKDNIKQLTAEKNALLSSLEDGMASGLIDKNSEAWYEMCNEIDDVTLSIEEANTALLEYNNNIRDIQWQIFDLLQDRISQVADESDFLIDLMENDKLYDDRGQLTDEGKSTMGLHGVNYNVYMAQADKYAEEMEKLNKQISADPYNQDLIDRRQELLELQQESILAAEDEKEAIVDMVEEGIELELDSLQELIDKYTDALDAQKDLYDYQNDVQEQAEEIASLQKQLSAYAGDTSEESQAKIQQLKVSLDEAQKDLEETEYDKYISDQKQLLDELYNEYELILNARLDNIDLLISDMISMINTNASDISATIADKADSVGYTLSNSMTTIWSSSTDKVTSVLTTYGQNVVNGITSAATTVNAALNNINLNIAGMITAINKMANTNIQAVTSSGGSKSSATTSSQANTSKKPSTSNSSSSKPSSSSSSWGSWFIKKKDSYPKSKLRINTSIVDRLKYFDFDSSMSARKKYWSKMGGSGTYTGSPKQNVWMIQQMKSHGYKRGRYNLPSNEYAWTQEGGKPEVIIRPSDGAILTPLAKSDSVLNAEATENLWKMVRDPSEFIRNNTPTVKTTQVSADKSGNGTYNGNFQMEVILPNVKNYEEFKNQMKHDKNFEKFVRSISVDRLFGKSALNKYK